MIIRPAILPDELDRSYQGRIMRLNGYNDPKVTIKQASSCLQSLEKHSQKLSVVEILSKIANFKLKKFVLEHTTMPLRRSITGCLTEIGHGEDTIPTLLVRSGICTARHDAYLCPKCVKEDQDTYGVSYWHREHQIPGVIWCNKHGSPLGYVDGNKAFLSPPSEFLSSATMFDRALISQYKKNKFIQKFIKISAELMKRNKPFSHKRVAQIFKQRAIEKNIRNGGGTFKNPLFSDIILEKFNLEWLKNTFPQIDKKEHGKRLHHLDDIFTAEKGSRVSTAYILAASILYRTPEEALNALTKTKIKKTKNDTIDPMYGTPFDDSELKHSYIKHDGNYNKVVSDIPRKELSIKNRLNNLGLPNLSIKNGIAIEFINEFIINRKSLNESIAETGISEDAVERLLRTLGNSYIPVMKEINKSKRHG